MKTLPKIRKYWSLRIAHANGEVVDYKIPHFINMDDVNNHLAHSEFFMQIPDGGTAFGANRPFIHGPCWAWFDRKNNGWLQVEVEPTEHNCYSLIRSAW